MNPEYDTSWLDSMTLKGPAKAFAKFCSSEIARRSSSEEDFDQELYEEAIKLVLKKLSDANMVGKL